MNLERQLDLQTRRFALPGVQSTYQRMEVADVAVYS